MVLVLAGGFFVVGGGAREGRVTDSTTSLPFSELDVANPMRGQYENLATALFPQSNTSQTQLGPWPASADVGLRVEWSSLQPVDPATLPADAPDSQKYDFSSLDQALDLYGDRNMRATLRVIGYKSCCDTEYPNGINASSPAWLRAMPGATTELTGDDGVLQVVPNWNDNGYLTVFSDLLAALGRRYDRDERLSTFEMSGYGDFSENHVATLRDEFDTPGAAPEQSEAQLGYYSQYRDQTITTAAADRITTANLEAFPNTRVVLSPSNPYITKLMISDSPALEGRSSTVGIRSDCLGEQAPLPAWAENQYSRYVEQRDPFLDVLRERYRTAPVWTEWCPTQSGTRTQYYNKALLDVVNYNVSLTASTGFPEQFETERMDPALFDLWSRATKYSGYRYSAQAAPIHAVVGNDDNVAYTVRWTNTGAASVHERWDVRYEITDADGNVSMPVESDVDLTDLVSTETIDEPREAPVPATTIDSVRADVGDLAPGRYFFRAVVDWDQHKQGATNTVDYPPMNLAQSGRAEDGSYSLATFEVR